MTCFFIGHRETKDQVLPYIIETAERLIQINHVNAFYVGGYGNFDRLAGAAIIQLKKKYQNIRLYLVIPYHPAAKPIRFRGRQIAHSDIGMKVMQDFAERVKDVCTVERRPMIEGRNMLMILAPKAEKASKADKAAKAVKQEAPQA